MSGVFDTQRKLSVDEQIERYASLMNNRKAAYQSLTESAAEDAKKRNVNAALEAVDRENEAKMARQSAMEAMTATQTAANRRRSLASLESRLFEEGKEILWKKVLFETVYDACWIDAPVKKQIIRPLYETFESTIGFLQEVCPKSFTKSGTQLLETLDTIITEAAKCASKRIAKEAMDDPTSDPDDIKFNLDPEEEEKFDQDLSDLGKDDIADKVKDKVLTVIQDEKEASKKKADAMKELDDEKADDEDEDDEDDSEDSGDDKSDDGDESKDDDSDDSDDDDEDKDKDKKKKKSKKSDDDDEDDSDDEDGENDKDKKDKDKKKSKKKDDDDEDNMPSEDDFDEDISEGTVVKSKADIALEALIREKNRRSLNNASAGSIFEAMMMFNRIGAESDAVIEGVDISIDQAMHASLMESIAQYTVLETLHTMGIINLTTVDTRTIRKAFMEDMNALSAGNDSTGKKMARIGTTKYKRNTDKTVMTQHSDMMEPGAVGSGEE